MATLWSAAQDSTRERIMKKKRQKSAQDLTPFITIIPNWLIEEGVMAAVGPTAWAVFTILMEHHNWQTGYCYPSFETIRRKTGIKDEKTIAKAIDVLQTNGLITYEYKKNASDKGKIYGSGKHTYTITHPSGQKPPKKSDQSAK